MRPARRRPAVLGAVLLFTAGLAVGASAPAVAATPFDRFVVIGDVHGEIDGFTAVLRAAGLIDADGAWAGGTSILVQTGDLVERGTAVREVLDLVMRLEREAEAAGGRVVAMLGNHEAYNLYGFLDYTSTPPEVYKEIFAAFTDEDSEKRLERARKQWRRWKRRFPQCGAQTVEEWDAGHPPGFVEYFEALGPNGMYGKWLRGLPLMVRIGSTLFSHGGPSPALAAMGLTSVYGVNQRAADELAAFDEARDYLVKHDLILPFFTLGEIYCSANEYLEQYIAMPDPRRHDHAERVLEILKTRPSTESTLVLHPEGPLWYRGFASLSDDEAPPVFADLLERWGVERIVVGHTPQLGSIAARFGRVFLVDTAMTFGSAAGGRAAALEIVADQVTAVYPQAREVLVAGSADVAPLAVLAQMGAADEKGEGAGAGDSGEGEASGTIESAPEGPIDDAGEPAGAVEMDAGAERAEIPEGGEAASAIEPPESAAGGTEVDTAAPPEDVEASASWRSWPGPDGYELPFGSDDEALDFLATARIEEREDIPVGITHPKKLLLEKFAIRAHAALRTHHEERINKQLADGRRIRFFRDSFANEVVAYELARLLAVDSVPPATLRKIGAAPGSVQLWVEQAMTENERLAGDRQPPDPTSFKQQVHDMQVFDNLINNFDRNQGNVLIDTDWTLWLIDHTRSFGREPELPEPEKVTRCSRRLFLHLRALDEERLTAALEPYLNQQQIKGILARRDRIVELLSARIAERGERFVLFSHGSDAGMDGVVILDPIAPEPELAAPVG